MCSVRRSSSLRESRSNFQVRQSSENGLENRSRPLRLGGDAGYQVDRNLEVAGKLEVAREMLERLNNNPLAQSVAFRQLSVEPYITRQIGSSGRLRVELGAIVRTSDRSAGDIPVEFGFSRPLGLTKTWRGSYEHRISTVHSATASYDGRKEPNRTAIHTGRAEIRAYF